MWAAHCMCVDSTTAAMPTCFNQIWTEWTKIDTRSKLLGMGIASSTIFFIGWSCYRRLLLSKQSCLDTHNDEYIDLITTERNNLNYAMSISCVDFFEGTFDFDSIKSRVIATLTANPWLCSRIRTIQSRRKAVYPLFFDEENIDSYLKRVSIPNLSMKLPYQEIVRKLQVYEVPMGCFCIDKNIPLFQVVLIEIVPMKQYALLVSMSHILGDGATFYNVFNMLNPLSKLPFSMQCQRIESYEEDLTKYFSSRVLNWLDSGLILLGVFCTVAFKSKANIGVFQIDSSAMNGLKESLKLKCDAGQIVSTNDIMTSWAIQSSGASFGMMAINLRGRLPGIEGIHAGNYQNVLMYRIDDCKEPKDIRESVKNLRSKSDSAPTFWETLWFNLMALSNWSTFYTSDLTFPGCQHKLHLPLLAANTLFVRGLMVIFRPRANELGVVILDRNQGMESWLSKGPFLRHIL